MATDIFDRTHPGYQRPCIRPDCPAAYNAADVANGVPGSADGWRMFGAVVMGQVCPDHAGPVVSGAHLPSWQQRADESVSGIRCSCGWRWLPGRLATQGEHQSEWVAHLIDVTKENPDG